jgi:protein-tyrosine phosphatase
MKVAELNEVLKSQKLALTILPSQEVRLFGEWLEEFEKGSILPLSEGSPYAMIEFPSSSIPRFAGKLFYEMQLKGFIPVIVHPERNQEIVQNPDKLYHLVKNGALTQITAASLVGAFGKNIKRFSKSLIEANLTHFIASDAHNTTNRSFKMREAFDYVENKYGFLINKQFRI